MFRKIAAAVMALAAGTVVLATAGPAEAARPNRPVTDTVRIVGNYDNGNHGYWASLDYKRTVRITQTGRTSWAVLLKDEGTFKALKGAPSPEAGTPIANAMLGRFGGEYRFTVESSSRPDVRQVDARYNFHCNKAVPNRADCPGMPATTGDWPKLYFGSGATVTATTWRWDYRTCKERWTTSNAGDMGDITGRPCVETVTPTAPVVVQPTCTALQATITAPSITGVRWTLRDGWRTRTMTAGHAYNVGRGSYRVTATALHGYRFPRHVRDSWTIVIQRASSCPTPTPTPTPTPSETVSPA